MELIHPSKHAGLQWLIILGAAVVGIYSIVSMRTQLKLNRLQIEDLTKKNAEQDNELANLRQKR